jgi:hypothetical protein
MSQPLLELDDSLHWDLVARRSDQANQRESGGYDPIPPFTLTATSNILLAGCQNSKAYYNWYTGAYLNVALFNSPSSTSEFLALMEVASVRVPLNRLRLIQLPRYTSGQIALIFTPPRWHTELLTEVWQYSGPESTTVEQALAELQTTANRIEIKVDELISRP